MSSGRDLDVRSILTGAAANLLITLPAGFIGRALAGDDENSNVWIIFGLLVLVGPLLGGAVAARRHRTTALMHGAGAAATVWAVTIIISVVGKLIDEKGIPVVSSILVGCIFIPLGVIGGYFTFRRELRRVPE